MIYSFQAPTILVVLLLSGVIQGKPQPQDSYGSPQAAAVDGYGSPQAPAVDSYGSPQAAPVSNCRTEISANPIPNAQCSANAPDCQESCQTTYEQKCETRYENQCHTINEQKCETQYENQCQTTYENVCRTEYDEQCNTVYDQKCETRYETTYEDKCETKYEQECQTVYEQKCETQYDTVSCFLFHFTFGEKIPLFGLRMCKYWTEGLIFPSLFFFYFQQCQTSYEQKCETSYETEYEQQVSFIHLSDMEILFNMNDYSVKDVMVSSIMQVVNFNAARSGREFILNNEFDCH